MQKSVHVGDGLLAPGGDPPDLPADGHHRVEGHRQDDKGHQGQFPYLVEDQPQQKKNRAEIPHHGGDGIGHHDLDEIHVVGDSGHQNPGTLLVKKGQGQLTDPGIKSVPKIFDDALGHPAHEKLLAVHARAPQQGDNHHRQRNQPKHLGVLGDKNLVNGRLDEIGKGRGGGRCQQHAGHGQIQPEPVSLDVAQQAAVTLF